MIWWRRWILLGQSDSCCGSRGTSAWGGSTTIHHHFFQKLTFKSTVYYNRSLQFFLVHFWTGLLLLLWTNMHLPRMLQKLQYKKYLQIHSFVHNMLCIKNGRKVYRQNGITQENPNITDNLNFIQYYYDNFITGRKVPKNFLCYVDDDNAHEKEKKYKGSSFMNNLQFIRDYAYAALHETRLQLKTKPKSSSGIFSPFSAHLLLSWESRTRTDCDYFAYIKISLSSSYFYVFWVKTKSRFHPIPNTHI